MPRKRKAWQLDAQDGGAEAEVPEEQVPASTAPAEPKNEHGKEKEETENGHHGFSPYPISKVYRLIEPGPVLLVTTGSLADLTHNVMTIGFHMVIQHEAPPLIGICLGRWDASFAELKRQRQCVLAVPSVEMAEVVVDVGNCSAEDNDDGDSGGGGGSSGGGGKISKWTRFGLDAVPAEKVKAPLVGGANVIANIECVVADETMVKKYSMWVLRPIRAWVNPDKAPGRGGRMFHHRGDGTFVVDGEVLDLKDRMVKWKEYQD